ncbi:hypothetical protein BH23GEM6_BH23GEM6_24620 [soil metagenome]
MEGGAAISILFTETSDSPGALAELLIIFPDEQDLNGPVLMGMTAMAYLVADEFRPRCTRDGNRK